MTENVKTWSELFAPLMNNDGIEIRPQQEQVGNAIISAMQTGRTLLAEAGTGTGKSLAVLLPLIDAIKREKVKGVVSTETNTLLDQYVLKDLPRLQKIYGGFTFCSLKGRSNYLCFTQAKQSAFGNSDIQKIFEKLDKRRASLGIGERVDIEKFLGRELDNRTWQMISGSSITCPDNKCEGSECFAARARERAEGSDIIITNHSVLRVDADMGGEFLYSPKYLFVDEAHTLESVLRDGWTEHLSEWEINEFSTNILAGISSASRAIESGTLGYSIREANEGLNAFISDLMRFYALLNKDTEWKKVVDSLQLKYLVGADQQTIRAMERHENDGPKYLSACIDVYKSAETLYSLALETDSNAGDILTGKDRKAIRKGLRSARELGALLKRILLAMSEKTGTVVEYGVPYAVTVSGIERRNGEHSVRISTVPLDISTRAQSIWEGRRTSLLSATLRDMTDGTYRFTCASLGIGDHDEITVDAPFSYAEVQRAYITPASDPVVDNIPGARYSFEELVRLIEASDGRSLVLFTARTELEDAAEKLMQLQAAGTLNYKLLVQNDQVSKASITKRFEEDTHSVLLGLRSFFTGNDFQGDTLSQVIICKYPLPQYNAVCKQQIIWWRGRGFPDFYERLSIETFRQAAGRLIRSQDCRGVVSLIDQRAADPRQRVFETAFKAVTSLGSPVIRTPEQVTEFLS